MNVDGILQCCVDYQIISILKACHNNACGGNFLGHLTTLKAMEFNYF
jgi:hypothetical protein